MAHRRETGRPSVMRAMRSDPRRKIPGSLRDRLAGLAMMAASLFVLCGFGPSAVYAQVEADASQAAARAAASGARTVMPDPNFGNLQAYVGDSIAVQETPDQALGSDEPEAPRASRPNYDFRMDYYRDSDENRKLTLSAETSLSIGPLAAVMHTDSVQARDPLGAAYVGDRVISVWGNLTDDLALGAGIGSASARDGWSAFIGSTHAWTRLLGTELKFHAGRELVFESAQTIRNHVMQTDLGFDASRDITDNLSGELEIHHRIFSDGNTSNELRFSPSYGIDIRATKLSLAYNFQYMNFAKPGAQESLGYWAPSRLFSNQGTVNWSFKWRDFYGSAEFDLGRSSQAESGGAQSGFAGSGTVVVGRKVSNDRVFEAYWTAGRDALGAPAGWSSTNMGFRLNWGL